MKHKLKEWLHRYLLAETIALIAAILATIATLPTHNAIIIAFAGAWADSITYYIVIYCRDQQKHNEHPVKQIKHMLFEFGPGALMSMFITRPFFMWLGPVITGNQWIGVLIGKVAADLVFYIPTITMYELKKKHTK